MSQYSIISKQIGSGCMGKVYQIQRNGHPDDILIIKVFDEERIEQYNKEKNILSIFTDSNNPYSQFIIKIKNYNITLNYSDYYPYNSRYLLFDYLKHDNLSQYLYYMGNFTEFSEDYVKIMCYKLLKALQIIHANNVCHNKIEINNIMIDNEFNPVIIHFSDASIENDNNYKKDFIGLANILAKLMTSGKFLRCNNNRKKKYLEIIDNMNKKYQDIKFWNMLGKKMDKFINFFYLLIKSKKNVDDLLKSEWLKDINSDNFAKIDNEFKKYLKERYDCIVNLKKLDKIKVSDINSILNRPINTNNSLFYPHMLDNVRSCDSNNDENKIFELEIQTIDNNEPCGIYFNYIEIITEVNDENNKNNILYNFMYEFQKIIEGMNENIKVELHAQYLSYYIIIEENQNEEKNDDDLDNDKDENNDNDKEEECNDFVNDDDMSCDEDNYETLIIKIELLQYNKNLNNDNIYNDKYYLLFNYKQGEICDYYSYLRILKEKAKSLLTKTINN